MQLYTKLELLGLKEVDDDDRYLLLSNLQMLPVIVILREKLPIVLCDFVLNAFADVSTNEEWKLCRDGRALQPLMVHGSSRA